MSAKYIFVTGGVVSSLGKGLAAASIGCLMESRGLKVDRLMYNHANTYPYVDYYAQPLDKLFKRKVLIRGEAETANILRNFGTAVDEIEEKRTVHEPVNVSKNYGSHCKSCPYQRL